MPFPQDRLRRLRATAGFRRLVRETRLSVDNLIAPFFVMEGRDVRQPIGAMPGQWRGGGGHPVKERGGGPPLGRAAFPVVWLPPRQDRPRPRAGGAGGIVASRGRPPPRGGGPASPIRWIRPPWGRGLGRSSGTPGGGPTS